MPRVRDRLHFNRVVSGLVRTIELFASVAAIGGVLVLVLAPACLAAPIAVTDDTGHRVTLEAPARRIVSLAPHLTSILFALDVGDEIVGTSRYSDYPAAAKKIPRLGDAFSVSVEAVVARRPDIVFAWRSGGSDRALARIEALGIPVFFYAARRLPDIARSVEKMAVLVGKGDRGRALAGHFLARLEALKRPAGSEPVRVFFQISDQNLYTVNNRHLIGQAIQWCGGVNVFGEARARVPMVSKEAVIGAAPDLILITRARGNPPSPWAARWNAYPSLAGKVAYIDPDLISRPGLRMTQGIARLCGLIQRAGER